jgi:hypothetical protein
MLDRGPAVVRARPGCQVSKATSSKAQRVQVRFLLTAVLAKQRRRCACRDRCRAFQFIAPDTGLDCAAVRRAWPTRRLAP